MTFWSGDTLEARLQRDNIIPLYRKSQIDCAAYTLRMGAEVHITRNYRTSWFRKKFSKISNSEKVRKLKSSEHFVIPPGQFAWLLTKEHINMPRDVLGFISLRSKYKFRGLINVSGFHVDPGFSGNLVYAVYNAGPSPIRLAEDEPLFLIWFADLDAESKEHYKDEEKQDRIKQNFLVDGEIISLQGLRDEINSIRVKINTVIAIALAISAVIGLIAGGLRISAFLNSHSVF